MIAIFYCVAISGGIYFYYRRAGMDYFALAFYSAIIYFLPGFFGYTSHHIHGVWQDLPMQTETYGVLVVVLLSTIIFSWTAPNVNKRRMLRNNSNADLELLKFIMILAIVAFIAMWLTTGLELLNPIKVEMMGHMNRWHILFSTALVIGIPLAIILHKYKYLTVFIPLLVFHFYIGFRSTAAIVFVSSVVIFTNNAPGSIFKRIKGKYIIAIIGMGLLFFTYKQVYTAIKYGAFDIVLSRITTPSFYLTALSQSEPFVTTDILNRIIFSDYKTSINHLTSVFSQFTLFAPELGFQGISFNDVMQPHLYPNVNYGVASNIWGQMWSAGGWLLLLTFLILYNCILHIGNYTLRSRSPIIRGGLCPVFCYWAFYIHRNDLSYAVNIEKRILLLLASSFVIILLYRNLRNPLLKI